MIALRSAKNTLGLSGGLRHRRLGGDLSLPESFCAEAIPKSLWTMVWAVAMTSGIVTSIILETFILWKQLGPREAFRTAIGMSLLSMLLMEAAMNLVDYGMMGAPAITLGVLPYTLGAGFLAAWPYNYWRLKNTANVVTER